MATTLQKKYMSAFAKRCQSLKQMQGISYLVVAIFWYDKWIIKK